MIYEVIINGTNYRLDVSGAEGRWQCRLDGREIPIDAVLLRPNVLSLLIGGKSYEVRRESSTHESHVWVGPERYAVEVRDPRSLRGRKASSGGDKGAQKLIAMMPGKVVRLLVAEKSEVEAGQGVLVVEAMKMQNEIKSPRKGTVTRMVASEGDRVNAGDVLAIVE